MFGVAVLVLTALYLWLLIWSTRRGWRWGIECRGWTGRKRWIGAALGFLIVYLPVFWDFIPTLVVHQYYCATEAGFWVYKTVDQWRAENPNETRNMSTRIQHESRRIGDANSYTITNGVNVRFNLVSASTGPLFLNRWRREDTLVDSGTNETIWRYVDFSTSQIRRHAGWSGWKFWLDVRNCPSGLDRAIQSGTWIKQLAGAK